MYNGIQKIETVIEEIEANITTDPDYESLAAKMTLSLYEFRRVFSFVIGCPMSEYIRKRRLSLAACEIMSDNKLRMQTISEKYGYATLSAFSKAFRAYHGFSPTACRRGALAIKMFPKAKFELKILPQTELSFRLINDVPFAIFGYNSVSDHSDTACCEAVWDEFYSLEKDKELCGDIIYASYEDCSGKVKCTIGERRTLDDVENQAVLTICESRWLLVTLSTTDDDVVNKTYSNILYEILPSAGLTKRTDLPTIEVFPSKMSEKNFKWEIRIPVE